jgi:hypothetical protein
MVTRKDDLLDLLEPGFNITSADFIPANGFFIPRESGLERREDAVTQMYREAPDPCDL